MKRALVGAGIVAILALTGCARATEYRDDQPEQNNSATYLVEKRIHLSDGRDITCIIYDNADYGGGISCDWAGAEGSQ